MTAITCRDIVRRALRKLSLVAAGMEPTGNEMNDGLETLQAIYLELAGMGVFGKLYDVVVTDATYTAFPQQRILCNRLGGVAITLPALVDPSAWPGGAWWYLGRGCYDYQFRDYYCGTTPLPPHDGTCIEINSLFDGSQQLWIYESNTARWIDLRDLNVADSAPLAKYSDGLAAMLAIRVAPEYGVSAPQEVQGVANVARYAMSQRNDGPRAPVRAEYF
jgi:hypothetical protein